MSGGESWSGKDVEPMAQAWEKWRPISRPIRDFSFATGFTIVLADASACMRASASRSVICSLDEGVAGGGRGGSALDVRLVPIASSTAPSNRLAPREDTARPRTSMMVSARWFGLAAS